MTKPLNARSFDDGTDVRRPCRPRTAVPARLRLLATIALALAAVYAAVPVQAQTSEARPSLAPRTEGARGDALPDDEAGLPAPSAILNRRPGLWEQYQPFIIAATLLMLVQTGFIGALLVQRSRRLRVQSALRESERRYAEASAAGAVGVWDWNFETSEIYVDPILKTILGFSDGEISSSVADWGSRVHPLDLEMVTARVQACIEGRVKEYEVEHRMLHKDGSVRWFLSRGSLVRRADGRAHHMVGTKVDITERKCAENANRETEAVLRASNLEIQNLAGRLIAAQEVERARIARELHDDLSQQLAGLSIALSGLKRHVAAQLGSGGLLTDVSSLQQLTVGLADSVRLLSHDLHPSVLGHAGLVPALADHCATLARRQNAVIAFSSEGDFSGTDPDAALCLYRVAQEALRNVIAHAGPCRAEVRLKRIGLGAELTVVDDGRGFEIARIRHDTKGLGLVSIGERVRLAGGSVSFITELNQGTRVRVEIPMTNPALGVAETGRATRSA